MEGKTIGIIVLVGIICFCIGGFGLYLYQQQEITSKSSEISSLNDTINALNDDLANNKEFDRLIFKAHFEEGNGILNEGSARAYMDEADYSYGVSLFDWGEIYYACAEDYFSYAKDNYVTAILYLEQAQDYITNDKTSEYLDTYLEYLDNSKELCNTYYIFCDNMRLACYYYNYSDLDTGDEKVEEANSYIEQINGLIDTIGAKSEKIKILFETSWKD